MKRILVLGSLNIDLVQRVPRLPALGETLAGGNLQMFVGGKGANQACAAARLGGQVRMAGSVGNDVFAGRLLSELESSGVDTQLVRTIPGASGSATILVLPSGENVILISPGANAEVTVEDAVEAVAGLHEGDFLLCQLEIPLDTAHQAMVSAQQRGVVTILDPAPACPLPGNLLSAAAIITPNQTEAAILLGSSQPPEDMKQAEACATQLLARGPRTVIVKMGELGCLLADSQTSTISPGFPVPVSDTTAAGDTFNGALAVALARGATLPEAARFANAAAALSVTKPGAINSIPHRAEVERFLREA